GESWCDYDGIIGQGMDLVGSRHYRRSCVDGYVYTEECRDYREELCTQPEPGKAVCRKNRWQDCAAQESQQSCEDKTKRDCAWLGQLKLPDIWQSGHTAYTGEKSQCVPQTPPALKHWQNSGNTVCNRGSKQRDCDVTSCAQEWVESTAVYCYAMADCGDYRNIAGRQGKGAFGNSDNQKPLDNAVYLERAEALRKRALDLPDIVEQVPFPNLDYGRANSRIFADNQRQWQQYAAKHFTKKKLYGCWKKRKAICMHTRHRSTCATWNAPQGSEDCAACDDPFAPWKDCTEYRCKSLGAGCMYAETNGTGGCNKVADDRQKPVVWLELPYQNLSIAKASVLNYDGYDIQTPVNPYDIVTLTLNISEPATCKVSMLPGFSLPMFDSEESDLSSTFTFSDLAYPPQLQEELMSGLSAYTTSSLARMSTLDRAAERFFQHLEAIARQFGVAEPIDEMRAAYQAARAQISALFSTDQGAAAQMVLAEAKLGRRYMFATCTDVQGNTAEPVFIRYQVGADKQPPVILSPSPEETVTGRLELTLNEPAECRWSTSNVAFDQMNDAFDCPVELGDYPFTCTATVPTGVVSVRCKDQPSITRKYHLTITPGNSFGFAQWQPTYTPYQGDDTDTDFVPLGQTAVFGEITFNEPQITADAALLTENDTSIIINQSAQLTLKLATEQTCKAVHDNTETPMQCGNKECSMQLDVSKTYYVFECSTPAALKRNEAEAVQFTVIG
ncbi:hypothetical protein HY642_02180, partial [Candidatus Woesearchaeota archaeon]|nr:hypothetical protein [Candidatus Woesearchaeota archaeon]